MREGSNDNVEPVQKTADPGRAGAEEGGRVKRAGPCCPKSKSGTTHSRHRANSIPRCRGSPEIARRAVYGWVHRGRSWESQAINGFSICVRHRKQSAGRQRCRIGHCPTSAPAARAEEPDRGSRFIPPKLRPASRRLARESSRRCPQQVSRRPTPARSCRRGCGRRGRCPPGPPTASILRA